MVTVSDSRLEGPGFESRCRQVSCFVLCIQEHEEELRETRLVRDIISISEVRRPEECFTTLQSGHLLYHSKANNGQAGVGFLINRKWKDHIVRVNNISPQSSRTCSVYK